MLLSGAAVFRFLLPLCVMWKSSRYRGQSWQNALTSNRFFLGLIGQNCSVFSNLEFKHGGIGLLWVSQVLGIGILLAVCIKAAFGDWALIIIPCHIYKSCFYYVHCNSIFVGASKLHKFHGLQGILFSIIWMFYTPETEITLD